MGVKTLGLDTKPEKFFDGAVFDPAKPEEFATKAAIHSMKA
jgi:hypothetical protein